MKKYTYLAYIFLFVLLGTTNLLVSGILDRKADPIEPNRFIGSWIGYESGLVSFYRLNLDKDGKGSCVVLFNNQESENYQVTSWKVAGGKLSFEVSPNDKSAESIVFEVINTDELSLNLTVSDFNKEWKRKVTLYNEKEWLARANRTLLKD